MKIEKFHIYLTDLNPRLGTEPGKVRPVVVVQTNLLNNTHPSTIVCPLTTKVNLGAHILRVHLQKGTSGLSKDSDILVDQIRAIDNRRFKTHMGVLVVRDRQKLLQNLHLLILR